MSLVLRKVAALNRSGALAVPVRYSEIKSSLESLGEEGALELLKRLEADGHSIADPVQYIKEAVESAGDEEGPAPGSKRKAEQMDGPIAKRIRMMNASGQLVGEVDYERVREPLASLSVPKAMTILKALEDVGADVLDPTSYIRAAVRGAGGFVADDGDDEPDAEEAEPEYDDEEVAPRVKGPKRVKHEGSYDVPKMDAKGAMSTDSERIERRLGWLNRNGSLEKQVDVQAALPALDCIGVRQAMRVLRRLEEGALTVQDPDAFIQEQVARSGWIWSKPDIVDDDEKIAKRVSWMNQFGGLQEPIDYAQVADSLDGLKVAHAMVLLRELEVQAPTVADPTGFIKKSISLAGEDDVQIPAVDVGPNTAIGKRVTQLNTYAQLAAPIEYNEVGEDLARIGEEAAMQLLQEVEDKGAGVKDPTGYLRFKLRAKLASLGTLEDVATASDETKILKRIEWLNDYGTLTRDINYTRVGKALESVGIEHAMTILKELEDKGTGVKDPDAFVLNAIATSRKRTAQKKPVATPPAKRVAAAAVAASGGGADLQTLFGVVGLLNKSGRTKKQIKFGEIASALDSLGSEKALRILQEMQEKGLGLDDPVQYIKAAAQRTLASRVRAVKAEQGEDDDDVAKITRRLKWLNQFGNLTKPIKIPEVVGALYCLGVPASMTILRGLQEKGAKVPDPTYHIKAAVQKANGVRPPPRPVKAEPADEEDEAEEAAAVGTGAPVPWDHGQEEDEEDAARALADGYEELEGEEDNEEAYYAAQNAEDEAARAEEFAEDGGDNGGEDEAEADVGPSSLLKVKKEIPEAVASKKKNGAGALMAVKKEEPGSRRVVGGLTGYHKLTPTRPSALEAETVPAFDEAVPAPAPAPIKKSSLPVTPQEKFVQVRNLAVKCGLTLDDVCLKSMARLPFYKVKDMIDDVLLGGRDRKGVSNPSRYLTIGCQKMAGGLGVEQGIAMELAVSLGVVLNNEALDELASVPRKDAHEIIKEVSKNPEAREDPIGFIKQEVGKCRADIEARPFPLPSR